MLQEDYSVVGDLKGVGSTQNDVKIIVDMSYCVKYGVTHKMYGIFCIQ